MHVESNVWARSRNHCCLSRAINITYYECVSVALPYLFGTRTAPFLRRIILSIIVIQHKMGVLIFSTTSVCSISHSKINCAIYDHKCTYVFT
jgi:hypothetical protein